MPRPFIAANWKMNKTVKEAVEFMDAFVPAVADIKDADILIAPPFTALSAVAAKAAGSNVTIAAQDVFYEEKGAFTGEVSTAMLKDVGCAYVIAGHSERRQYFGDTDEVVNRKLKAALKAGLGVIFCIGETLEERNSGRTFDVLKRQLKAGLEGAGTDNIVVAYEPIWAIGTGVTATTEQAQEAHAFIRKELSHMFGSRAGDVRILYGGSVTPENVDGLMACRDVNGALVGGASLKPDSFSKIARFKREG